MAIVPGTGEKSVGKSLDVHDGSSFAESPLTVGTQWSP